MKASDLLAILQHNDPGVQNRVQKIKHKLNQLKSFEKCNACGDRVHYVYCRKPSKHGDQLVVEAGTCQGCFGRVPVRAFAIH